MTLLVSKYRREKVRFLVDPLWSRFAPGAQLVETYRVAEVYVTHSSSLRCCVSMREQRRNITTYRLSPCTCRSREPWSDHRIALRITVSRTQELRHSSVHTTITYMSMACGTLSIEATSVQSQVLPPRMRMGVVGWTARIALNTVGQWSDLATGICL